jgi:glycosyltransferase involved in cell wall biosynthesis
LKVLHFSALDGQTGAGIAAARIHEGLLARGIDSRFCVAHPIAGAPHSFTPEISLPGRARRRLEHRWDRWLLRRVSAGYDYVLSTGRCGFDIGRIVAREQPDIVQLHWIGGNSFRLSSLAGIDKPIVWRLSDQWPFCGVQHLEPNAAAYVTPPAKARLAHDPGAGISERVRWQKAKIYKRLDELVLVCPSRWLAAEAKRSALLGDRRVELIPTSCDTDMFSPRGRGACRSALGLPPGSFILLVGATTMETRWKGADLFVDAVSRFCAATPHQSAHIAAFGKSRLEAAQLSSTVGITHFGPISDRRLMSILYNAADAFCAPSRMENLANTVLESLACGTPVIAFAIGGMPDMIDHGVNGYIAAPFDTADYANGIAWMLAHRGGADLRNSCRVKITTRFSLDQEIGGYHRLYQSLCESRVPKRGRLTSSPQSIGAYEKA